MQLAARGRSGDMLADTDLGTGTEMEITMAMDMNMNMDMAMGVEIWLGCRSGGDRPGEGRAQRTQRTRTAAPGENPCRCFPDKEARRGPAAGGGSRAAPSARAQKRRTPVAAPRSLRCSRLFFWLLGAPASGKQRHPGLD